LKILIANLLLARRSGTEVFTEQLADGLRRAGHDPVVWVSNVGPQGDALRQRGHVVIDRLDQLPWCPDIIHGHHNVMTATALAGLPGTPAVFVCHDASASFDTPPLHPRLRCYLAVDELCRRRLTAGGVRIEETELLLNAVDELRYIRRKPLPDRPARALVLTKQSGHLDAVREACREAGLHLDELGIGVTKVSDRLEDILPDYDIVFATARMALEAAFAGCAVVVCDERGMAGMLTSGNILHWREWNLGKGLLSQPTDLDGLRAALNRYDATDAGRVTDHLRAEASLSKQVEDLLAVYRRCLEAQAASLTDASREAQITARFMEDWLPSFAPTRPWRTLATELLGAEADLTSPLIAQVRDQFFQRLSNGLDSMRPETTVRDVSLAFRKWSLPAKAFTPQAGKLERDHIVVPMTGHEGNAIYGPYEARQKGSYEVFFDVSIDERRAGGKVLLDVAIGAQSIVAREIAAPEFVDVGPISLRFELENDSALIEYRVALNGFDAGSLRFGGVTLIRDQDPEASPNPSPGLEKDIGGAGHRPPGTNAA
tara:strand:+ start:849 stop:2480 length:1632 start_codon:yes stop_codon:yes gene_type:complete